VTNSKLFDTFKIFL